MFGVVLLSVRIRKVLSLGIGFIGGEFGHLVGLKEEIECFFEVFFGLELFVAIRRCDRMRLFPSIACLMWIWPDMRRLCLSLAWMKVPQ